LRPRRYLITGGAGFIGSNFIRHLLNVEPHARVTNLDLLTYAGVRATVEELDSSPSHHFLHGDIRDAELVEHAVEGQDVIVHFAAESHVDRSIAAAGDFLTTNVIGTSILLDAARRSGVRRFLHVSTDEVYGSIPIGRAAEDAPLSPSSPYSASKAGADLLVLSYVTTYDFEAIVTRCTNNYGPYQHPEKLIPRFVTNAIRGLPMPLYADGRNERDWLHVQDHVNALHLLLSEGEVGEVYNIGADAQQSNIDVTHMVLNHFGLDESWIEWTPDRPGHDLRYAVDSSKLRSLGWAPEHSFEEGLPSTIAWYEEHEAWWRPLVEGA